MGLAGLITFLDHEGIVVYAKAIGEVTPPSRSGVILLITASVLQALSRGKQVEIMQRTSSGMKRLSILVLILFSAMFAFADGGGGMYFGYQTSAYPFLSDNYSFENNSLGLAYYGGFGYGVTSNRTIVGGFGMAIMDIDNDSGIAGGFGGVISGFRLLKEPISLSLMSMTGFGGIYTGDYATDSGDGFFALSEELTLELGIPIISWFMPTVYAGYQIIANVIPGRMFQTFLSYTPVFGIRLQWGDFH